MGIINGERWERWKNLERVDLHLEKKSFSISFVDGLMRISEFHHSGVRAISLDEIQVSWLKNRLLWKSKFSGIDTRKIWRKGKDSTLALYEKSNRWGTFISVEISCPSKDRVYIVIPGGIQGNLWKQFAIWISPSNNGFISPLPGQTQIRRSYAEAVQGDSLVQNSVVIASLQQDIVFFKTRVQELTEQLQLVARKQEFSNNRGSRSLDAGSSCSGDVDITLVQNTADDVVSEGGIEKIQTDLICVVKSAAGVDTASDGFAANEIPPSDVDDLRAAFGTTHMFDSDGTGKLSLDKVDGDFVSHTPLRVGNADIQSTCDDTAFHESELRSKDPGYAKVNVILALVAPVILVTADSILNLASFHRAPVIRKSSCSRWHIALQRLKRRNEEDICSAWKAVIEASCYRKKDVVPEESTSISTMDLSAD